MFENMTVTDSNNSKVKYLMIDDKQLTVEINNETSGICFSGRDKLNLSLIRRGNSNYLEKLSQELSAGFNNFHDSISQQKYTKLTIDLDRSKVFSIDKKYPLNKLEMRDLFEYRRCVSGRIKFCLYHRDDKIFLISTVETLTIGDEVE